jgi:hypothetical protein
MKDLNPKAEPLGQPSYDGDPNGGDPPRLARTKLPSFFTLVVVAVTILGAGNFCLAMFGLVEERDTTGYMKIALISTAAFVVAFAIYEFATKQGAPQAARGYWTSASISLLALIFVGFSLFAATYAGQTIKPVQALRDAAHGVVLQRYAADRIRASRKGSGADDAIRDALNVLIEKRACELARGCIGLGQAGPGPITRVIDPLIGRAKQAVDNRGMQTADGRQIANQVNALLDRYRLIVSKSNVDVYERRRILEGLHGKIEQRLNELDGVEPAQVARGYAGDLRRGVSIAGRPGAEARLNAILTELADAIDSRLQQGGFEAKPMPSFPTKVGVSDTFAYIGAFLPIAGVIFTIESVLPLLLWIFAFNTERWHIFLEEQRRARKGSAGSPLGEDPDNDPPRRPNGGAADHPELPSDPIDGPYGWSGRSRYNAHQFGKDDDGGAS